MINIIDIIIIIHINMLCPKREMVPVNIVNLVNLCNNFNLHLVKKLVHSRHLINSFFNGFFLVP